MIQKILTYRISHQIEPACIFERFIFRLKHLFRLTDGPGFQTVDDLIIDKLYSRQFHLIFHPAGPKGAPCRRYTDPLQPRMQLRLQTPFHLICQHGHFLYILDLSVNHRPLCVVFPLNGNDLHPVFLYNAHHPDHAARTDIQGKYHVVRLRLHLYRHLHRRFLHLSLRHAPRSS